MSKVTSRKEALAERFASEEKIGIYYERDVAVLPDGNQMGRCTNCAWYVVMDLQEGKVMGFHIDDNPSVTHEEIICAEGHDFALIEDRYIVDLWISLYTGQKWQIVFDLQDPADAENIQSIYGDPACWSQLQPYPYQPYDPPY